MIPTFDNLHDDPAAFALNDANNLLRQIHSRAASTPDAIFLEEVGGHRLSYADTVAEIERCRHHLASLGLVRNDRLVSLLPASINGYILWLAAGSLGIWEIAVNRELKGSFLKHQVESPRPRMVFVSIRDADLLATEGVAAPAVEVVAEGGDQCWGRDRLPMTEWPAGDDVACVIYTSGTTGPAKGVMLTWAQLAGIIGRTPREWLDSGDVAYTPWPSFHITGRSPLIVMADVGGRVVIRDKFSLSEFWADIDRHRCTFATIGSGVPFLVKDEVTELSRNSPLKTAFGVASGHFNLQFQEKFGVNMMFCYGSTEVGFPVVNLRFSEDNQRSAGFLRPGYQWRLVNEGGADVAEGEAGELWLRPPHPSMIFKGYLDQPEATARAVVDGWYRTGDLLRRDGAGRFVFVDRIKDTIKRRGENISASEYEGSLQGLAEVGECSVIGVKSELSGAEIYIAAAPRAGVVLTPEHLFELLRARYPKFMLPSYISLAAELPKTPSGKVSKPAVLAQLPLAAAWRSPLAET